MDGLCQKERVLPWDRLFRERGIGRWQWSPRSNCRQLVAAGRNNWTQGRSVKHLGPWRSKTTRFWAESHTVALGPSHSWRWETCWGTCIIYSPGGLGWFLLCHVFGPEPVPMDLARPLGRDTTALWLGVVGMRSPRAVRFAWWVVWARFPRDKSGIQGLQHAGHDVFLILGLHYWPP